MALASDTPRRETQSHLKHDELTATAHAAFATSW